MADELQTQGDHLMVIDEINRANVPKVFGELLLPARAPRGIGT